MPTDSRHETLLAAIGEGILIFESVSGRIVEANAVALKLLECRIEELSGKRIWELAAFRELAETPDELEKLRAGVYAHASPLALLAREGTRREVEFSSRAFENQTGQFVLCALRDVSARMRTEADFRALNADLRALAAHLNEAREEERERIAREIHDELGQNLTALRMEHELLRKQLAELLPGQPETVLLLDKIDACSRLVAETIEVVRRICSDLRPSTLDHIGLPAAIEQHAREFQARSGIRCSLSLSSETLALDAAKATALYRIFQEILTNVARHAKASRVTVSLKELNGRAILEVSDNGQGLAAPETRTAGADGQLQKRKGLGILGMRERARALGGSVEVNSAPGTGTAVTVGIPLAQSPLARASQAPAATRRKRSLSDADFNR